LIFVGLKEVFQMGHRKSMPKSYKRLGSEKQLQFQKFGLNGKANSASDWPISKTLQGS
jgi:hypothetical protein